MKPLNEWKLEWEGDETHIKINLISQFTGEIRQLNMSMEEMNIVIDLLAWIKEGYSYTDGFGDSITEELDFETGIQKRIPEFFKDYLEE